MENLSSLHERIRHLADAKNISLTKLADAIGEKQQTFQKWLKPGSEKNIWERLPKILALFPDVSDVWLYIGRGPFLAEHNLPDVKDLEQKVDNLKNEILSLQHTLEEKNQLNDQLTKQNIALFDKCQRFEEKLAFLEAGKVFAQSREAAPGSQAVRNMSGGNEENKQ